MIKPEETLAKASRHLWIGILCVLFFHARFAPARDFVVPVTISNLVFNPADLFDLQGRTVRFTPFADGSSYHVRTLGASRPISCNQTLEDQTAIGPWYSKAWSISLPFTFPFGGKSWTNIYINTDGNISFDQPESQYVTQRDPWADGGMCSVAAAIDSRSVAGFEKMIAVFWGPYQGAPSNSISIDLQPDCLAITWNVTRAPWGQAVLGPNTFQARLFPSGEIEMTYPHVVERDGIVGVFPGSAVQGKLLSHWQYSGKAPHPSVDVDSADVYDNGTVLDLTYTMKQDAVTNVASGPLDYRCWVNHDGITDMVSVSVTHQQQMACWLGAAPLTGGWKINGRRVDMFVSKVLLANTKQCSVNWDVTWWGESGRAVGSENPPPPFAMTNVAPATIKFSKLNQPRLSRAKRSGNIFEVFHYPVVTRSSERLLKTIYQQMPAQDDLAVVFTDFRIDDLFGQGNGAIAANVPISGIGKGNENPRSTADIGSTNLQMSVATVWLGAPMFDESGIEDDGMRWLNFARGAGWIAHESTHRWGMSLSFQNPITGKEENLADEHGHWREGLDTTAMFSTTDMFMERPDVGPSIMGGYSWRKNSDGTFSRNLHPFRISAGYSALDLYVMGLLPAAKVPATTLIDDLKDLGGNRFQGTSVPVRIEDVLKAMGPRQPDSANAQKVFKMTFYVAHEAGREADPVIMLRAEKLSTVVTNFFSKATGGVMKIVPVGQPQPAQNSRPNRRRRRRRDTTPLEHVQPELEKPATSKTDELEKAP